MDGISAAERQPTNPEDGPKDNETYAEDGNGEDDIDTEDGIESTVVIGRAVVRRAVVRRAVSIRTSLMKGWFKNILQVHKNSSIIK